MLLTVLYKLSTFLTYSSMSANTLKAISTVYTCAAVEV